MRLFGGERIKGIMSGMGMGSGEPIYHPWLNRSIEKAQKKVEERTLKSASTFWNTTTYSTSRGNSSTNSGTPY